MGRRSRIGLVLANVVLVVMLVGLLGAYLVAVHDLPSQIYTVDQRAFLSYNRARSVAQVAPVWEAIVPDAAVPAVVMPVQHSRVRAVLDARYETQGSVSATVYDLDFAGAYRIGHTGAISATVALFFPFPAVLETLHEVRFTVDGVEPVDAGYSTEGIRWQAVLAPGEEREVEVSYRAEGAHRFSYGLQQGQRTDVDVIVSVRGLAGAEAPESSLPPSAQQADAEGEEWRWQYVGLIAERDIALTLPEQLSFAQRVARLSGDFRSLAQWAPVLVVSYLASLAAALYLGGVRLRLASYLLAGCGTALFYPLLTFLGGVVGLVPAGIVSLALVSALLVAFAGLTAGWSRAAARAGLLLLVFLGCFSLGTLTPWSGLFVTGGALILVGAFMLLYARRVTPVASPDRLPEEGTGDGVRPAEGGAEAGAAPEGGAQADSAPEMADGAPPPPDPRDESHCPYCARPLADDYAFCPGCGQDTRHIRRCGVCGQRGFVPQGMGAVYCVRCGAPLAQEDGE
ncbi:MAG: zinc ribbon domain-containing protein [Anaerolineae bacterium]|nr:zinc ribbon domain-containing protein [Anaerolineae bacterium]